MGIERRKNKKENKKGVLKTLGRDAILAAGVLAAAHTANVVQQSTDASEDLPLMWKVNRGDKPDPYLQFRQEPDGIIDERHGEKAAAPENDALQLHKQLADDARRKVLENSQLAADLGIHDIGKTPKQVLGGAAETRKAHIDAAIKKVQKHVLKSDSEKKKK